MFIGRGQMIKSHEWDLSESCYAIQIVSGSNIKTGIYSAQISMNNLHEYQPKYR